MTNNPRRCSLLQIEMKAQQSLYFLAQDMLPRFLNSRFGFALIKQLHAREIAGEKVTAVLDQSHPTPYHRSAAGGSRVESSRYACSCSTDCSDSAGISINGPRTVLSACQPPISTVALDKNKNSSQFWLEMFKTMSETVSVGMVVADMNVPGCPLAYINEGFKTVTGKKIIRKLVGDPWWLRACLIPTSEA